MDPIDTAGSMPDAASETDSPEITNYAVGYGKPPLTRRFKSGQSGNRRGRPRGSKNCKTIVREIANEMHTVTEDGRLRRRSILEFMLLALRNRGAEGDVPAFRAFRKYLAKYDPRETDSKLGYIVLSADVTPEEAIAEGETANAEARARRTAEIRD